MTPDAEPISGTRRFVLAVLACGMLARVLDANPHPTIAYLPFVLTAYVLPLWYASGRARGPWESQPSLLLAAQAVATFVPFALFGREWVGGVSGLLGGLVLLVVQGRASWLAFAALAVIEEVVWLVVGLPPQAPLTGTVWVVVAFVTTGMTLFGLTRLADLMDQLRGTHEVVARDEVARLRLAATARLQDVILLRLEGIQTELDGALAHTDDEPVRLSLINAGQQARQASSSVRELGRELPADQPADAQTPRLPIAPTLARVVSAIVVFGFAALYLVNVADYVPPGRSVALMAAAVLVCLTVTALQLRHVRFDDPSERPRAWPWTLAVQAVLGLAMYPLAGASATLLVTLVVASALVLIRRPIRWLLVPVMAAAVPVLTFLHPTPDLATTWSKVLWSGYAAATEVAACLLLYGLARLTQTSVALEDAARKHAAAAATREVLRLARDTHDTLGLGLSTIALKSDLAAALLERDPARARHEIAQAGHLARVVAGDVSRVGSGHLTLDLAHEVATAELGLRAAGASVVTVPERSVLDALEGPVAATFAAVLREAATNVLRHSRAVRCSVGLDRSDGRVVLTVINDGVADADGRPPGQGLDNMAARLRELDGSLTTRVSDDRFTLVATVPDPIGPRPTAELHVVSR